MYFLLSLNLICKRDHHHNCFQDKRELYQCMPQNKLSPGISSCDDDRFVQRHLTDVWVCDWSFHSLATKSFSLQNTISYAELKLKMQSFVKRWTRIWWLNRLKGWGAFSFSSCLRIVQIVHTAPGLVNCSSLDRFLPSCFSAIPRISPPSSQR